MRLQTESETCSSWNSGEFFRVMICALTLWASLMIPAAAQGTQIPARAAEIQVWEKSYESKTLPLLRRLCFECHSGEDAEAEIDLAAFETVSAIQKDADTWLKVRQMLNSDQMPPRDAPQPSDEERLQLQTWVGDFLTHEARVRAGDPGPVILRRLNNAEYNYTVQDLTGVASLDPTREFPVDGAAGEGFTNTGSAQSMSPALVTKYLDAGREVASHAVLLPDGIRFSPYTSRRDHTDELMARIQSFYRRFTQDGGGTTVDLQGIRFSTNQGGLLPVLAYVQASLEERAALASGLKTAEEVASERSLNPRYFAKLMSVFSQQDSVSGSVFIDDLRTKWHNAEPQDAASLVDGITQAQQALWKFNSVGQLTDGGQQKKWMEAVSPIVARQDLRLVLPHAEEADWVSVYLIANDLGDGREQDFVMWDEPRLEFAADRNGDVYPAVRLRDLSAIVGRVRHVMASALPATDVYLRAVHELRSSKSSLADLAASKSLNAELLSAWVELVGLNHRSEREIRGHFTSKVTSAGGYAAVNGWGVSGTPSLLTNRSQEDISFLTLTVPARGVVVHPSPDQESVIAWRSPVDAGITIQGLVKDTDPNCGNGFAWRIDLMQRSGKTTLSSGVVESGQQAQVNIAHTVDVRRGDVVFLVVSARDNNHVCDTTHVALKLSESDGEERVWDLATDVVEGILNANPLPDSYGHADIWHFAATKVGTQSTSPVVAGSALAKWRTAVIESRPAAEIKQLALAVRDLLTTSEKDSLSDADQELRKLLTDWKGPLRWIPASQDSTPPTAFDIGIDVTQFGKHPDGSAVDSASLCLQAPHCVELRIPTALAFGSELVARGELHAASGRDGSVQLQLSASPCAEHGVSPALPIVAVPGSEAWRRVDSAMDEFRNLFPAALSYSRIVPVDEVVTMTLYFREDDHLQRLMLNEQQVAELDRLWDELLYVSQEPIALTVAFEQIYEFATQDRPDLVKAFAPMRQPINERGDAFRRRLVSTEPGHLAAVLAFADRAWRRPLSAREQLGIRNLYNRLRQSDISHEQAIQLTLAQVLSSPSFLYRREQSPLGKKAVRVSDTELASRLSYFLWSSLPDDELRARIRQESGDGDFISREPGFFSGELPSERTQTPIQPKASAEHKLLSDEELVRQTRRLLRDSRTRRLAIQFACQWLHLRDFDQNDDKNEKLYPRFSEIRDDMYEETVRFFDDMFRHDGSILGLLDADHTFLNETLARHYGMDDVSGPAWRRVQNVRSRGRGGILGMATVLASQSGASRTSPILRGNWIYETLLGERLPRPPANVPQLPETVPTGLSARQLIERHSSVAECAKCHRRIDPYGFALEQYDAIGRLRPDSVDTTTILEQGQTIEGIDGLREYLLTERRADVVRQFCRKLLGYALGREIQLSDEVLLEQMRRNLEQNEYRFYVAVETIVLSEQFRRIRGSDYAEQ